MIIVEELLWNPEARDHVAPPEADPLREPDALQEAQLLAARVEALSSTVGLLFELRTAMQLREANTAVLVSRGVREFTWSAEPRSTEKTAWNVVGSEPRPANWPFEIEIDFIPRSRLRLVAESVEFYVGDVEGLEVVLKCNCQIMESMTMRPFEPIWLAGDRHSRQCLRRFSID